MAWLPKWRHNVSYALFLLVPVVLYLGAYIYPLADTIRLSGFSWDGMSPDETWVGWDNYVQILQEPRILHALANNMKWLVYYLVAPTLVGLGLALLLDADLKGSYIFRTIFFVPFTITTVAVAATWRWIYDPNIGLLTETLRAIGLRGWTYNWLGDPTINTYAIMGASLWAWSGFIEAARIDGASPWLILTRIKLPLLLPSTIVIIGVAGVDSMRVFDIVWAMTQGGPYNSSSVLAIEMYQTSFARFDLGAGAAVAVLLLAVAAVLVMPYIYYLSGRIEDVRE
jgi:multiple sugar transport system permease protein/raffinose/stachyose/melibiose transport system permease protein